MNSTGHSKNGIAAWIDGMNQIVRRIKRSLASALVLLPKPLRELQSRSGLAAKRLSDEEMVSNVSALTHNLSITSSNLNRLGLWSILWKQKPPTPADSANSIIPGGHDQ